MSPSGETPALTHDLAPPPPREADAAQVVTRNSVGRLLPPLDEPTARPPDEPAGDGKHRRERCHRADDRQQPADRHPQRVPPADEAARETWRRRGLRRGL